MFIIRGYLMGFFISIYCAITERSLKAGLELWRGWRETEKSILKDYSIFDTAIERDDKIVKNSLDSISELERKLTQGQK